MLLFWDIYSPVGMSLHCLHHSTSSVLKESGKDNERENYEGEIEYKIKWYRKGHRSYSYIIYVTSTSHSATVTKYHSYTRKNNYNSIDSFLLYLHSTEILCTQHFNLY